MLLRIWKLISMTFVIWGNANASRMAAALAYFTMLSLAPVMMIAIAIAGYIYSDKLAATEIIKQVETVTTPEIGATIADVIERASLPQSGIVAGTISICVLVFAASGVFTQLYDTFNDIWEVSFDGIQGFLFTVQKRLLGIGMVIVVGIMLVAALILESVLAYINGLVEGYPRLLSWLNLADRSLSFLLMPIIFSMMFWFFPATKIQWRDVWPAGILTACLIAASRYLIGFYMKFSSTSEVYGAMGSLAVLLIWVYMTGLVVFFGASFSHAWAETFGSRSDFGKKRRSPKTQTKQALNPNASSEKNNPTPLTPQRR